ncbi:MAG: hypothetical protein AAGK14_05235 [Verrucomicrobiota bacterium]
MLNKRLPLFLLLMSLAPVSALLGSETIPQMFRDLQRKAELHAVIETLKVDATNLPSASPDPTKLRPGQAITVEAKVVRVLGGSVKVKPGSVITIRYDWVPKPVGEPAAPAPIPVLRSGITRQAWLNQEGGDNFVPAAFAYSFNEVPAQLPVTGGPVAD